MGFLSVLILIVRAISIGMAAFSTFTVWRTIENTQGFGGVLQLPDAFMVAWNIICTLLAGSAWFATPKKIVDTFIGLLNGGGQLVNQPSTQLQPQSGVIVSAPTIQDFLAAIRTWLDQNAGNDQPLAIEGQAFGFELKLSAKPLPRTAAARPAAISQADLDLLLNRVRTLEAMVPAAPVAAG